MVNCSKRAGRSVVEDWKSYMLTTKREEELRLRELMQWLNRDNEARSGLLTISRINRNARARTASGATNPERPRTVGQLKAAGLINISASHVELTTLGLSLAHFLS